MKDVEQCIQVAHRAYRWHQDKAIYFHLFVKLMQTNEREQAMEVLRQNFNLVPFDKVTNFISEEETFDLDLNKFYRKAFVEMERVTKEVSILRNLTQFEYF